MQATSDLVVPNAVSLARILTSLGPAVLTLAAGQARVDETVDQVVFYDKLDALPTSALVLGIGLHDAEQIIEAIGRIARVGPKALVVRAPLEADPRLTGPIERSGICLFQLALDASWTQLLALLKVLFAKDDAPDESSMIGGVPAGDLFAAANVIRALVDAPITIEDFHSQLVAFSVGQEDTDAWRVETILGRQVPEHQLVTLEKTGFLRELYASERPRYLGQSSLQEFAGVRPRVAIAVRAGHEVLGSIWAVVGGPLDDGQEQLFIESADLIARHLLRLRAGAGAERRLRTASVASALRGEADAGAALSRLGLAADTLVVVALGLRAPSETKRPGCIADDLAAMEVAADRLSGYLATVSSRAAAAKLSESVYAIIPLARDTSDALTAVVRLAEQFLQWIGDRGFIAIGCPAQDVQGLARSRLEADQILGVLRRTGGTRRVARLDDVRADVLLLDLASRDCYPSAPVRRLIEYDAKHNSQLVETLRAWLNTHGDNIAAAAAVHVHPNTFRYRLRRILQVGQIDLADSDARFAADLHLRLLRFREGDL